MNLDNDDDTELIGQMKKVLNINFSLNDLNYNLI